MLDQKNMLLIGATASNLGKTELACMLISRYCKAHHVIGVKVTAITEKDGTCPRGGMGCGVCSSLEGNYCITRETSGREGKDTIRMLKAGAQEVYWLRVLESDLEEGYLKLREKFSDDAIIICESNRVRQVASPGLFVMVADSRTDKVVKTGALKVMKYVDQKIFFDGKGFDFSPERIVYGPSGWGDIVPGSAASGS
jgi:hypothetical protein